MSFGKRLKSAIKYKHTTQKDLAKTLNTTPQSISQYVSGKRNPKKDTVAKLANALNLGYTYTKSGEAYFYTFIDTVSNSEYKDAENFNRAQHRDAIRNALVDTIPVEELAGKTGIPAESIQGYVEGATAPQIEALKYISNLFKLSLAETDDLFSNHYEEIKEALGPVHNHPPDTYKVLESNIQREPFLEFSELIKKELLSNFDSLSKQGQEKLYNYSCDLLKIPEYGAEYTPNKDNSPTDEVVSSNQEELDKN